MNPWIAKAVILAASVAMVVIRAPHGRRSRGLKVVRSCKGPREVALLTFAWIGFLVPLIWVVSPVFSFAEYSLRPWPLGAGVSCLVGGLWWFHRSLSDLGTYWSVTLELREHHRRVASGAGPIASGSRAMSSPWFSGASDGSCTGVYPVHFRSPRCL
jgi:protein-S-isoprenylcysteine O-methyltransferase Ste14